MFNEHDQFENSLYLQTNPRIQLIVLKKDLQRIHLKELDY